MHAFSSGLSFEVRDQQSKEWTKQRSLLWREVLAGWRARLAV
jgi:hypothetical protein